MIDGVCGHCTLFQLVTQQFAGAERAEVTGQYATAALQPCYLASCSHSNQQSNITQVYIAINAATAADCLLNRYWPYTEVARCFPAPQ